MKFSVIFGEKAFTTSDYSTWESEKLVELSAANAFLASESAVVADVQSHVALSSEPAVLNRTILGTFGSEYLVCFDSSSHKREAGKNSTTVYAMPAEVFNKARNHVSKSVLPLTQRSVSSLSLRSGDEETAEKNKKFLVFLGVLRAKEARGRNDDSSLILIVFASDTGNIVASKLIAMGSEVNYLSDISRSIRSSGINEFETVCTDSEVGGSLAQIGITPTIKTWEEILAKAKQQGIAFITPADAVRNLQKRQFHILLTVFAASLLLLTASFVYYFFIQNTIKNLDAKIESTDMALRQYAEIMPKIKKWNPEFPDVKNAMHSFDAFIMATIAFTDSKIVTIDINYPAIELTLTKDAVGVAGNYHNSEMMTFLGLTGCRVDRSTEEYAESSIRAIYSLTCLPQTTNGEIK